MEEQLYAVAKYVPPEHWTWLKPHKPYGITRRLDDSDKTFFIIDEEGDTVWCQNQGCRYLKGGDWTIIKESALTNEQRHMAGLPPPWPERNDMADALGHLFYGAEEDATIAELRERIEALEARVPVEEKAEPEWPREDDEYFWITSGGMAAMSHWGNIIIDEERCKFLGIYKTQEETERRAKQVRIVIKELNNGHPVKLRDGQGTLMP